MINLDGSYGEGGGQIVRTALALSSLTGQPFKATNIRSGRKDAGLKAQHVHCIKALQQICSAKADGAEKGSKELLYIPGKITAKNTKIDIGTAGSITLLLQAVLMPCMFANKTHTLNIIGGTDTAWSMPIDYFTNVLVPQYKRICEIEVKVQKRGYYPKGGGQVELKIKPTIKRNEFDFEGFQAALKHKAFSITEQGKLISIKGTSHASKKLEQAKVAERQAGAAKQTLAQLNVPIEITTEYADTFSKGSGITLWAIFAKNEDINLENPIRLGADSLGEPGKPAEKVGTEAAQKLLTEIKSGAPIDSHLADNLIPLMALCKPSKIKTSQMTSHAKTNMWVVEQFLGKTFKTENNTITSN
ncbi:RNA 3'-terminal phosphate cyclase [Candidatus Woesearchaeota archaeon]|nr:RNA 3'-terminal phosphate cyclase [Candidatus Woesearchaeota archaeon]MBW3016035.1 RNA 3'-terminal phosphate cyclase [Candidatus Woesearchaeota archaeon]